MTADRFRTLIEGAIVLWQTDTVLAFDDDACRCRIGENGSVATIEYRETGLGGVWRIEAPQRTPRVHRSVVPALATLRDVVCPGRPRARALFVPPAADIS